MDGENKSHINDSKDKLKIFAYGFETLEFDIPNEPVKIKNIGIIEFIPLNSEISLESADGLIIPQGVFETFKESKNYKGLFTDVKVNQPLLLQREKQVTNLLSKSKWVCFLVGKIMDFLKQFYGNKNIKDTDLCKRILNGTPLKRHSVKGLTIIETKYNEFKKYLDEYGIANTSFEIPHDTDTIYREIAISEGEVVGVEGGRILFFLPFHTIKKDKNSAISIVKEVTQAIFDYRQKNILEIPKWTDELKFNAEEKLEKEIISLTEQLKESESKLQNWKRYKGVLSSSHNILKNIIVQILENFFEFKIDPIDKFIEDAKIIDEQGNILCLIEVEGTKKGITREKINQVDSHREKNNIGSEIPGILFINNEMSIQGIDNRQETKVPKEQIKHAKNLNVLIVRTIDLLFFMKHLENNINKKNEFMKIINSRGGWLKADSREYKLITE